MADATLAIAFKEDKPIGDKCAHNYKFITGTVTFDGGDYVTGGIAWDLSKEIPVDLNDVFFTCPGGSVFYYNKSTGKIQAFSGGTEHTQSAISDVVGFLAIGK